MFCVPKKFIQLNKVTINGGDTYVLVKVQITESLKKITKNKKILPTAKPHDQFCLMFDNDATNVNEVLPHTRTRRRRRLVVLDDKRRYRVYV